jgi:hypothetical protein
VGGQEIEDNWHERADVLDTRSLSVEAGNKASFFVERSVLVAEVGAVVFKGRQGSTVPSCGSLTFKGGGRSALVLQGSESGLDTGLCCGGGIGSSHGGRLQGGLPVSCSSIRCALVGGCGICTLASDSLLVLSLRGEGGSIRGRLWLRGHGDRERGSGRRLQDLKSLVIP